jgi:hypothetical protein
MSDKELESAAEKAMNDARYQYIMEGDEGAAYYDGFVAGAKWARPKWINPAEQMPEECDQILFWIKDADSPDVGCFDEGFWYPLNGYPLKTEGIAGWMPMLKPPDNALTTIGILTNLK